MKTIYYLTLRNIKSFTRDKMGFFFSMLSPLIVLALYFLFIRGLNLDGVEAILAQSGITYSSKAASFFLDSWMFMGLIGVTSITLPLGIYSIMVEDRSKNIYNDFTASPVTAYKITLSYILSVVVISSTAVVVLAILCLVYMLIYSGYILSFLPFLGILGVSILSCICSSVMIVILVNFITSMGAFSGLNAILGVIAGFLTGAYMPLSMFPTAVQTLAAFIPTTSVVAILRKIYMNKSIPLLLENATFATDEVADAFSLAYGGKLKFANTTMPFWSMFVILLGYILIFLLISIFVLKKKKKI